MLVLTSYSVSIYSKFSFKRVFNKFSIALTRSGIALLLTNTGAKRCGIALLYAKHGLKFPAVTAFSVFCYM